MFKLSRFLVEQKKLQVDVLENFVTNDYIEHYRVFIYDIEIYRNLVKSKDSFENCDQHQLFFFSKL